MNSFRITKYNPANRDHNGHYLEDTWSSSSQIGQQFGGKTFTLHDYLMVEADYIACLTHILQKANIQSLQLKEFEDYRDNTMQHNVLFSDIKYKIELKDNQCVDLILLNTIVKLALREAIWCKLITDDAFIHFGYDLYSYIGVPSAVKIEKHKIGNVYIESYTSPYL